MTRKDYKDIANILSRAQAEPENEQRFWIIRGLADLMQADNSRFDRIRFQYAATEPIKENK